MLIAPRSWSTSSAAIVSARIRDSANASGYGYGDGGNPTFGTNPVGLLETRPRSNTSNQLIGSAFGELQLLPSLRYRLAISAAGWGCAMAFCSDKRFSVLHWGLCSWSKVSPNRSGRSG